MFRHQISAEVILALLCLCSGTAVLVFMISVFGLLDGNFSEQLRYMGAEELAGFSLFMFIGLLAIVCGVGLFKRQRWAIVIISLIIIVVLLLVVALLVAEGSFLLRRPMDFLCISLVGIGAPLCLLFLFNSVQVFPWLAPHGDQSTDVLDQL